MDYPRGKSQVAVVYCASYEHKQLHQALLNGLCLLGGPEQFVNPGESILLKPNFLSADISSPYTTTAPELFGAVAEIFATYTNRLSYGDSPAAQSTQHVAERCGIARTAEKLGVTMADFQTSSEVECPQGFQNRRFPIVQAVQDADVIISLSRMKTHGLTRMTGAIKNQFGYIPGLIKASYHARMPKLEYFSRMLVELNLLYRPRLYIMDAIIAMEGNGPGNGTPRTMSLLLLSKDPVALDATACRLMNLDPTLVETNIQGQKLGLGNYEEAEIEILGEQLAPYIATDYKVHREQNHPPVLVRLSESAGRMLLRRPYIDKKMCVGCGLCVKVCPVDPKALSQEQKIPHYDYNRCIRCFCCQELCPQGAVKITSPLAFWRR